MPPLPTVIGETLAQALFSNTWTPEPQDLEGKASKPETHTPPQPLSKLVQRGWNILLLNLTGEGIRRVPGIANKISIKRSRAKVTEGRLVGNGCWQQPGELSPASGCHVGRKHSEVLEMPRQAPRCLAHSPKHWQGSPEVLQHWQAGVALKGTIYLSPDSILYSYSVLYSAGSDFFMCHQILIK